MSINHCVAGCRAADPGPARVGSRHHTHPVPTAPGFCCSRRGTGTTKGLGCSISAPLGYGAVLHNNFDRLPGALCHRHRLPGMECGQQFSWMCWTTTPCLCLSNHILALFDGAVSNSLPTTSSCRPPTPTLHPELQVNHLPWLEGMVTWWPLDLDGTDIFGASTARCWRRAVSKGKARRS